MNYPDPSILILNGLIRFVKAPPKNSQRIGKQNLCEYTQRGHNLRFSHG